MSRNRRTIARSRKSANSLPARTFGSAYIPASSRTGVSWSADSPYVLVVLDARLGQITGADNVSGPSRDYGSRDRPGQRHYAPPVGLERTTRCLEVSTVDALC
jgi:hypothetical protein